MLPLYLDYKIAIPHQLNLTSRILFHTTFCHHQIETLFGTPRKCDFFIMKNIILSMFLKPSLHIFFVEKIVFDTQWLT